MRGSLVLWTWGRTRWFVVGVWLCDLKISFIHSFPPGALLGSSEIRAGCCPGGRGGNKNVDVASARTQLTGCGF